MLKRKRAFINFTSISFSRNLFLAFAGLFVSFRAIKVAATERQCDSGVRGTIRGRHFNWNGLILVSVRTVVSLVDLLVQIPLASSWQRRGEETRSPWCSHKWQLHCRNSNYHPSLLRIELQASANPTNPSFCSLLVFLMPKILSNGVIDRLASK